MCTETLKKIQIDKYTGWFSLGGVKKTTDSTFDSSSAPLWAWALFWAFLFFSFLSFNFMCTCYNKAPIHLQTLFLTRGHSLVQH